MKFWQAFLKILDTGMKKPQPYGWFHLMFFALSIIVAVILCVTHKKENTDRPRKVVLITAIIVILLEIYKLINYSFSYENGITFDFPWYVFPWQFCSTPMYVGLLAGLTKKGKIHDSLCAYLATYAIFAGVCVMFYPVTVFIRTIGVNIQTMICHGSMITVGAYLLYSGYVKLEHKTILKAMPVFVIAILVAIVLNEIAFYSGLLETDDFNMFFISPHSEPSLPVYSIVQEKVMYPWCLFIYVISFSLAAYIILLVSMLIKNIYNNCKKTISLN